MRWLLEHVIWDPAPGGVAGVQGAIYAARKLLIAVALSLGLDWMEWREHHPPEMALIALIHLAMTLALVTLVVFCARWIRRRWGQRNPAGK